MFRGNICGNAAMAQLVEHILGKDEVPSSNLGSSSKKKNTLAIAGVFLFSAPLPINSHRVSQIIIKLLL